MEFSIVQPKLFINIFDTIKQFSSNVKMYINEDLHIQTVDDANISIIDIKLNKSYFDIFKCEKPVTFDFSLDDLCKILKICRNSRVIHFL